MSRAVSTLAAAILVICASACGAGTVPAQGKQAPEAAPPSAQKGASPPSLPQRPATPAPGEDAQGDEDDFPNAPQACPDTGRKLELIV